MRSVYSPCGRRIGASDPRVPSATVLAPRRTVKGVPTVTDSASRSSAALRAVRNLPPEARAIARSAALSSSSPAARPKPITCTGVGPDTWSARAAETGSPPQLSMPSVTSTTARSPRKSPKSAAICSSE